jgi:Ca-activated chloride channel family protein
MMDKEIRKKLKNLEIPEPDSAARRRAIRAALEEFDRNRKTGNIFSKGFAWSGRLLGKIFRGGPVMFKPVTVSAGVSLVLAALIAAIAIPQFSAYRSASTRKLSQAPEPAMDAFRTPAAGKMERAYPSPAMKRKAGAVPYRLRLGEESKGSARRPQEYVGRDRFEYHSPNPLKLAAEEPVSTFSVDVDTTSYSFCRRALQNGHMPPVSAVRIEELINYFDYDYPVPKDRSTPFRPSISVFPSPWNRDTLLLHIGIKGFEIVPEKRPRANLVFLVDVSGSMNMPDKLPLLKNALRMLVETLDPEDTVAMVVYAGAAGTVLEQSKIRQKGRILAALDRLSAGGSTAGGAGIRKAYALAEEYFDPEGVNRVILATDGDFNVGIRDPETLKNFVERKRNNGIYLSVLGFGQGNYNDALMQKLAQNGNGNASYIDNLNEARKVLVEETMSTLFPIAKDVKIQVEFNPARVSEYRLIGYESRRLRREDFNNDRVDAGEIGAGHSVTALYEITPVGSRARLVDDLRYGRPHAGMKDSEGKAEEIAFLRIRYKLPDSEKSRLMETPVSRSMEVTAVGNASEEARFASAVAAFGQLLRGEPYLKDFSWDDIISLAETARGRDRFGYRTEFLNLVRLAKTARAMGER